MAIDVKQKMPRRILALVREHTSKSVISGLAFSAARQILVFGLAILLARVQFIDGIFPFGLAFVIGVPDSFSIAALAGYVINNWIGTTVVGANSAYIGAVGVVAAVRWILTGLGKRSHRKTSYLPCLVAGLASVAITELAILILTGTFSLETIGRLAGGIALAGSFSYFYHISFDSLRRRSLSTLSNVQKASLALALCTAIMALYPLNIGPFSAGRLAGGTLAIFAVYAFSAPFDAAVLAAVAAAIAISEPSFIFSGTGIFVAGVLGSLFKKRGKPWFCLIFIVTAALFIFTAPSYVYSLTYISEILFSALIFLVVPLKNINEAKFRKLSDSLSSATTAIGLKLDSITTSMRDVTLLLDKTVSAPASRPNFSEIYSGSVDKVCRGCSHASQCWVKCYDDSTAAMGKLTPVLAAKGAVTKADFPAPFNLRCINMTNLAREISDRYSVVAQSAARGKNAAVYKEMIKKQFGAVCEMLDNAREELTSYREWDEAKSRRIYDCAARLQLPVESSGCIYDHNGRAVITVTLRDAPPDSLTRRFSSGIGSIVGRPLNPPSIESANGNTVLCFTERPVYQVITAAAQLCAEAEPCGDIYHIFSDLRDSLHILLSDGMGTGSAAAREGTICCAFLQRLLESGFPVRRAAELANSALSLRADIESASTIDVLNLNVFDGTAHLFKAGAAPTFCLHGTKISRLEGPSLPVGILSDVVSKEFTLPLEDDDIVVMISDGISDSHYHLVDETLRTCFGATPEEICREIICRVKRLEDLHDDVTVIVAKLAKNDTE